MRTSFAAGHFAALPWFRRATEIDPQFATAYAWLARMLDAMGESDSARAATIQAWRLRDRTTELEKFYIEFSYYRLGTGNLEKARETCRIWAQTYPRDPLPHGFLGSSASSSLARFANAESALQRAAARKLDIPDFVLHRYVIAFLKGDAGEMQRLAALGEEMGETEDLMLDREGSVLAYSGHLRSARVLSRRAVDLAVGKGRREAAAQHVVERGAGGPVREPGRGAADGRCGT